MMSLIQRTQASENLQNVLGWRLAIDFDDFRRPDRNDPIVHNGASSRESGHRVAANELWQFDVGVWWRIGIGCCDRGRGQFIIHQDIVRGGEDHQRAGLAYAAMHHFGPDDRTLA